MYVYDVFLVFNIWYLYLYACGIESIITKKKSEFEKILRFSGIK